MALRSFIRSVVVVSALLVLGTPVFVAGTFGLHVYGQGSGGVALPSIGKQAY